MLLLSLGSMTEVMILSGNTVDSDVMECGRASVEWKAGAEGQSPSLSAFSPFTHRPCPQLSPHPGLAQFCSCSYWVGVIARNLTFVRRASMWNYYLLLRSADYGVLMLLLATHFSHHHSCLLTNGPYISLAAFKLMKHLFGATISLATLITKCL